MTDELIELGYRIVAISPDSPSSLASGKRSESEMRYTLLSDSKMKAAGAFGIAFRLDDESVARLAEYGIDIEASSGERHHLLPVPSIFASDEAGKIVFQHVDPNYRVRLAPEVLLAAAKAAVN